MGGPNCRTRSVLRHYKIEGQETRPRPLRAWGGQEFGLQDLSPEEQIIADEDDVLLWRMVFLFMVTTCFRQAQGDVRLVVGFELEQPASPKHYMPQVVSFWDTKEWLMLKEHYNFHETTFHQTTMGGSAVKPTTMGGNLSLDIQGHQRKKSEDNQPVIHSSKDLARWPPGVMQMLLHALMIL